MGTARYRSIPWIGAACRGYSVVLLGVMFSGVAHAADPSEGQQLARHWCSSCHAIAPYQASNEQAPSFESIVQDRSRSNEWISTWLSTPHELMPDLALTRDEITALVAYFDSLRPAE